jgi:hypothetical protein
MNYPIWDLTGIGGGTLIALIAVLHVYVSHLAVGGGLFLWLTDLKATRDNDPNLLEYVRRHTWFFLLLSMVFGGLSGVGIWFVIALVSPAATSELIHTFVFGWAIEWVFFVGEIAALLIYHYRFDAMKQGDRQKVAFMYFLFAWLSMVIINGILSFMLTPGAWLTTGAFWDGFFNPTYFPSLAFRSAAAVMIAGIFGLVTAVATRNEVLRRKLIGYNLKWLLYPLLALILTAWWYYTALPADIRLRTFMLNPQTLPMVQLLLGASVGVFLLGLLFLGRFSLSVQRVTAGVLVLIGLGWMGGFEYTRELSRKPYVIGNFMYITSITRDDVPMLDRDGILAHARWSSIHAVDPAKKVEAGREVFRLQCQSCHTIHGFRNDIARRIEGFTYLGIQSQLAGLGRVQSYMPPFVGTAAEKEALAVYLAMEINGTDTSVTAGEYLVPGLTDTVPSFDAKNSEYVLLAWNNLGMHCLSDGDDWFCFLPPANTLEAQILRRGDPPVMMRDSIVLSYRVEKGHEHPSTHTAFWKNSLSLVGKRVPDDVGIFGKGMSGNFDFDSASGSFIAAGIPAVPYRDDGTYNAYPVFTVEAKEKASGRIVAVTKVVAPVSSEIGCRNCHGGGWRKKMAGMADETAINILATHDRLNGTDLLGLARSGKPQLCQTCHEDPAMNAAGKPGVTNFSAAMHGWHALYMPYEDSRACALCHPAQPKGITRCLRDPHGAKGVGCTDCHGSMSQHATSVLMHEKSKEAAGRILAATQAPDKDKVAGRIPWEQETDCLACHVDFQPPARGATGFNAWSDSLGALYRMRSDMAGVRCPACHGSTHAVYPTRNPFFRDRDNLQPLQYSGTRAPIGSNKSCAICHKIPMQDAIHHPNMERPFRNAELLD